MRSSYAVFPARTGSTCTINVTKLTGNVGLAGIQIIETDETPPCGGDFNGDGTVNGADFGLLLAAWGECVGCPEDLNSDGEVNGADVGLQLAFWGPCS